MLQHRFCSICGSELKMVICSNDDKERPVCRDESCNFVHYFNPKPTVKAVVFNNDKVLMVRRAEEPRIGGWDFPGGYLEWDEHPEEGVVREVLEETGLVVKVERTLGVFHRVWNATNADSSILNVSYLCRYISGEPEVLSPHEIDRAEWVSLDDLPGWVAFGHFEEVLDALKEK